jgi:hypothetical protein
MPDQTRIVAPVPRSRAVVTAQGQRLDPPADWVLLPPGDAGLTRRVKAAGPTWTVQEKVGRKVFSRGVWAPAQCIAAVRAELQALRATDAYAKRREAGNRRRERVQSDYVRSFRQTVESWLAFAPCHAQVAGRLADAVTAHATPVGSGTVARTRRISIQERAESAVIAWMRHRTTAYDSMAIPRIKGQRREVRRMLAERSRRVLAAYRAGLPVSAAGCPLQRALSRHDFPTIV